MNRLLIRCSACVHNVLATPTELCGWCLLQELWPGVLRRLLAVLRAGAEPAAEGAGARLPSLLRRHERRHTVARVDGVRRRVGDQQRHGGARGGVMEERVVA